MTMPVKEFTAHQLWCRDCGTCGVIQPDDYDRYRLQIERLHRGHKTAIIRDVKIRYWRPLPGQRFDDATVPVRAD